MVNVNKSQFQKLLNASFAQGTPKEREALRTPAAGLFPRTLFPCNDGRTVDLTTWMTAFRANKRGKLALQKLVEPRFETATLSTGQTFRKRLPVTAEDRAAALAKQDAIITAMVAACPGFFSGLVEEETSRPAAEPIPGVTVNPEADRKATTFFAKLRDRVGV